MRQSLTILFLATCACGTIVGNPRQPKPSDPKPTAIVYALPEIDFDVGDAGTAEAALSLTLADVPAEGNRTLIQGWGARTDKIVAEINKLSKKVNAIVERERESNSDDTLIFKNRGGDGRLSGKLMPLADGGDYAYQAVLCRDGTPFTRVMWSKDGHVVSLTRDFSSGSDDGAETFTLRSEVIAKKGDAVQLTVRTEGEWTDEASGTAQYLAEYTEAAKAADGVVTLRAVADRGAVKPETYEGDSYLVGQLTPLASTTADGRHPMRQEFVAYDNRFPTLCAGGFNEDAADLWHPELGGGGPRFCLGRPAGEKRFGSVAQFYQTLEVLKPVGIAKKEKLGAVVNPADLSCE